MQPVVGVLADQSNSKWGRRRPFMVGGSVIVALCLLMMGWAPEIVASLVTDPDTVRWSVYGFLFGASLNFNPMFPPK